MSDKKNLTQKYWNSLSSETRYRALKSIFPQFSDNILNAYSKESSNSLGHLWKVVLLCAKMPSKPNDSGYKLFVSGGWQM